MAMVPLAGAEKRLLHPAVPVAFFGLAVLAHVAAWGLVALAPLEVLLPGGPGPGLAAVHVLTLGVLVATAAGAVLQILPVTTQQNAPPLWLGAACVVLLGGGAVVLVGGFLTYGLTALMVGAGALGLGVLTFAVGFARLLAGGRKAGLVDTLPALWLALASLLGVAVLAVLLAADYRLAWLPDHAAAAAAHLVVAAYGFMGFLVIGFSHILVPMLAVAEPPPPGRGRPARWLAAAAVGLAAGGLLLRSEAAVWAGLACGLAASGLHVRLMMATVARRLRRKLGPSFVLIRLSWALLPLSLAAGGLAYAGVIPPAVFGVLVLPGWLLTLLLGILQRILPFLASMHTVRTCAKPLSAKALEWEAPLRFLTLAHPVALALLTGAAATGWAPAAMAAGGVGSLGAVAFLLYAITVFRRARRHRVAVGPKTARPPRRPAPPLSPVESAS